MAEVRIRLMEGLVVGPEDRLFIHIPASSDWDNEMIEEFVDELYDMGLGDRALVLVGEGIKFAKVEKD
jgi:hypothetical protein